MANVMDSTGHLLMAAAGELVARAGNATNSTGSSSTTTSRPPSYKIIGLSLAIASGLFIGTSFVLKKVGLLKANEKYNEEAGEGYGYLKNAYWWSGMTLMIIGEICNFVAYAFTDAILVTPLGALSVVITTILSAIFLKERLSMIGKVSCFLCIVGSVVIVMNAPQESSVANIQQMQHYVITPGFLSYAGVIIVGSVITAFWVGPRYGKKNMLVYLSICSWVGGLSVVATQGLGSAIVAQAGGQMQFNQWFLYILLVFVVATLLTEIIFLNKALNLFNAAMVTPTYYVYFTSTTILTSAVLFQGFKGTPTSIVTVVLGFLTICSGVVLLQLSKSAKDVPDVAVFAGDLDQVHTIAEQEQPETEPKADAIRGTAALLRRFSVARQKMELEELRRLHEEKQAERLAAVSEDGNSAQYEWDGLRRRKTFIGSTRSRAMTSPNPFTPAPQTPHPPLGMSHFPTEEELEAERIRQMSPGVLSSIAGTIRGRGRSFLSTRDGSHGNGSRSDLHGQGMDAGNSDIGKVQSPMHPVQLTEIAVPAQHAGQDTGYYGGHYGLPGGHETLDTAYPPGTASSSGRRIKFGGDNRAASMGSTKTMSTGPPPTPPPHSSTTRRQFSFNMFRRQYQQDQQDREGTGVPGTDHAGDGTHEDRPPTSGSHTLRPGFFGIGHGHGYPHRGYSSPQVKGATEEEQMGLVKGDSHSMPSLPSYEQDLKQATDLVEEAEEDDDDDGFGHPTPKGYANVVADDDHRHPTLGEPFVEDKQARYGRGITSSSSGSRSPPGGRGHVATPSGSSSGSSGDREKRAFYERVREDSTSTNTDQRQQGPGHTRGARSSPPRPPPPSYEGRRNPPGGGGRGGGGDGAFI